MTSTTPFFDKALQHDLEGNYRKAIENYQDSIREDEDTEAAYLNLIVILIQFNYEQSVSSFLASGELFTEEEIAQTAPLLTDLLNTALQKFPGNSEFVFWKYYAETFFRDTNRQQWLDIVKIDPDTLIPYFWLYLNDQSTGFDTSWYQHRISTLKEELKKEPTIKNKYVLAYLEEGKFEM